MATSTIITCDLVRNGAGTAHGVPATARFEAILAGRHLEGDLCDECGPLLEEALVAMGIRPAIAFVDGKPRREYRTKSGARFTTSEAREWLLTQGYDVPAAGRIKDGLIQKYADEH